MTTFKAKRIDNGEWVYGFYYQDKILEAGKDWRERHLLKNSSLVPQEVDPLTLHQEIGGEWYTMGELEKFLPSGMVLEASRSISSMTESERQEYWDEIFENPDSEDSEDAIKVMTLWHSETVSENAQLKEKLSACQRFRIEDGASAIDEQNSLRGQIDQLKAEVERLTKIFQQGLGNKDMKNNNP